MLKTFVEQWVLWLHDFSFVSHLSPTVSSSLWVLWPHDFTRLDLDLDQTKLGVNAGMVYSLTFPGDV